MLQYALSDVMETVRLGPTLPCLRPPETVHDLECAADGLSLCCGSDIGGDDAGAKRTSCAAESDCTCGTFSSRSLGVCSI